MTKPNRYREITVSGSPRELGLQLGESAKEEIRGFCDIALERVNKTVQISRDRAYDIARRSGEFARQYRPDLILELLGTAEAAGLTLEDLLVLQVRNQYQKESAGGCTSVAVSADAVLGRGSVVAQTWDNDPALDEFTIVLTRRPQGKPSFITCTQAGLISYMGVSETGVGTCVNTLPAPCREVGVPHYFILREMYEANSLDDAVTSVERAHRAIPVNIMMTTPQGPADLEVTLDRVRLLRPDPQTTYVAHTNHCVHPDFVTINDEFPELAQSFGRKQRIDQLLKHCDMTTHLEQVRTILSDHENHPTSICRHASDDPVTGFWETVFAIIIEPDKRRLHITRGTPCNHSFEIYDLHR